MAGTTEHWSGRAGFILATIGSAIGLGSIWKFPYEVGANGGSGFILLYVGGLALIVMPLMLAEFVIGRRGRADAATCLATLAQAHGAPRRWAAVGWLGVIAAGLILSFYSVIAGWALAYVIETIDRGLPGIEVDAVQRRFDDIAGGSLHDRRAATPLSARSPASSSRAASPVASRPRARC